MDEKKRLENYQRLKSDGEGIYRDPVCDRYYFADETGDFIGPYVTRQEAVSFMKEYARLYL